MQDRTVPHIPVVMLRRAGSAYPRCGLPEGFAICGFREGFDRAWARIETAAGEFKSPEDAVPIFHRDFPDAALRPTRCLFALDPDGVPVATASLWTGDKLGPTLPRVHWVATDPKWECRGLCKALLTALLDLSDREYPGQPAFLTSQTTSWPAIRLYLRFGFEPVYERPAVWTGDWQPEAAWRIIRDRIARFGGSDACHNIPLKRNEY